MLITGASKGIGRATGIALAKAGARTIIVAARTDLDNVEADILINNTGYLTNVHLRVGPLEWGKSWGKSWEVSIHGLYLVTRAFLPLVQRSPTRTIVNVSSIGAHSTRFVASAYQTAKLAALRFTEYHGGENGVEAFSIHPCAVITKLSGNMPDHMQEAMGDTPELAAETLS